MPYKSIGGYGKDLEHGTYRMPFKSITPQMLLEGTGAVSPTNTPGIYGVSTYGRCIYSNGWLGIYDTDRYGNCSYG